MLREIWLHVIHEQNENKTLVGRKEAVNRDNDNFLFVKRVSNTIFVLKNPIYSLCKILLHLQSYQ